MTSGVLSLDSNKLRYKGKSPSGMSYKIKLRHFFAQLVYHSRISLLWGVGQKRQITAINYHLFTEGKVLDESLEISCNFFEKQIETLFHNASIEPCSQCLDSLFTEEPKNSPRSSVLLTVDDADAHFLKVLPILERYNATATLFVPVGLCLGPNTRDGLMSRCLHLAAQQMGPSLQKNGDSFFKKILTSSENDLRDQLEKLMADATLTDPITTRKLLSVSELKAIARHPLITVASHAMSHTRLALLPRDWATWEIRTAAQYIREWGGDATLFSYPYGHKGSYDQITQDILRKNAIRYAFTAQAKIITQYADHLELGRSFSLNFQDKAFIMGVARGGFQILDFFLRR